VNRDLFRISCFVLRILTKVMLYIILIFTLVLRLVTINQSLWLDEAIGALAVRNMSYSDLITGFLTVDNHPPLYYFLLKFWTGIFGYSEISLRMPSVLFGVGTVFFIYLIGNRIFDSKKSGLIAAVLLSSSQLHIYYSQEARMYSMVAFFAVLAVYSFLHLFEDRSNFKYWLLFSSSITVMVFTDYMPVFLLPAFFIYAIFQKHKKNWWYKFMLSFVPIILAGIIWFPIFQKQSAGGLWLMQTLPEWKNLAGGANLKQLLLVWMKFTLGRISFTDKTLYYLITVIASIPNAILFANAMKSYKKNKLLLLWLLIPILLSFLISVFFPAFIYFRLLFVLPAFYLIAAISVGNMKSGRILAGMLIAINLVSCVIYYTDDFQKREMWREAVTYVENRIADNEIVIFSYPEPFAPYRWYEKKEYLSFGATDSIKTEKVNASDKTRELVSNVSGVYYFEYLNDLSDPTRIVMNVIVESGFTEKEVTGDFNGVGMIYHFVR